MPRTIAFGDIHGCLDHLDALLHAILPTPKDHLVFLGDYIDRGPDSAGVLNRLLALRKNLHVTTLMGNHEQLMLDARSDPVSFLEWTLNGGDTTLASYGPHKKLRDIPTAHWHFLEHDLVPYLETKTHIFVHANVYPDLPMSEQPDYMLLWERCDQSAPHHSGKHIICGHTPQKSHRPLVRDHLICIDTLAFRNGLLTAFDVTTGTFWQAPAEGPVTTAHLSDFEEGK
ncbi:MAG TPA: metallophosphoesterase family protein [Phycisphaerae bacterium]|nr:metallophosphoesterase family protein [Phycisphaerae bacterium]